MIHKAENSIRKAYPDFWLALQWLWLLLTIKQPISKRDRDVYFIILIYKMLLFISNIKHRGGIVDIIGSLAFFLPWWNFSCEKRVEMTISWPLWSERERWMGKEALLIILIDEFSCNTYQPNVQAILRQQWLSAASETQESVLTSVPRRCNLRRAVFGWHWEHIRQWEKGSRFSESSMSASPKYPFSAWSKWLIQACTFCFG